MQKSTNGNGYNGAPRGQQGRPEIKAKELSGEALVRQIMEDRRDEIEAMFAKDDNPKACFTRGVGLACSIYKALQQANQKPKPIDEHSTAQAALWAFQRKLDPGVDVYFVPYAGKVTPIISPQGLINLAARSGMVLDANARWVFQKEVEAGLFDHELGSTEWVKHKKGANARPRGKQESWDELAFAYAIVNLKGGGKIIEVHDRADIEYYRSLSKASAGLWFDWPAEAARKAVLKQALGRAPKQSEVSEILTADAANEALLEVPEELMAAAQAHILADVANDGQASGQSNGAAQTAPPEPAKPMEPAAGDPTQWYLPGKPGTMPTVAKATDEQLVEADGKLLKGLDAGEFSPGGRYAAHRVYYMSLMLTIRETMRGRGIAFPAHPAIGEGYAPAAATGGGNGELSAEEEAQAFADANGAAAGTY